MLLHVCSLVIQVVRILVGTWQSFTRSHGRYCPPGYSMSERLLDHGQWCARANSVAWHAVAQPVRRDVVQFVSLPAWLRFFTITDARFSVWPS